MFENTLICYRELSNHLSHFCYKKSHASQLNYRWLGFLKGYVLWFYTVFEISGIKMILKYHELQKYNLFYSIPSVKLWAVVRYSWIVSILQQICVVGNISTKDSSVIGLYVNQQKCVKSSRSSFAFKHFNNLDYTYIGRKYL